MSVQGVIMGRTQGFISLDIFQMTQRDDHNHYHEYSTQLIGGTLLMVS